MKKKLKYYVPFVCLILMLSNYMSFKKKPNQIDYLKESKEAFDQRMEWWKNSKFGLFVHWGIYAVPGGIYKGKEIRGNGEWIMDKANIPVDEYETFAKQFNPTKFNAEEWVKIIKNAGMKYLVITSKHHDGFAMWKSKVSNYNIVDFTPYGKDVLKALSKACKKHDIKFGLYHSIMDWHHPDAQLDFYLTNKGWWKERVEIKDPENFAKYLENYMKPQIKELIENYDPEILWFDGEWIKEFTHEQGLELYQYVRSLKPSIIINNRVDKGRRGMQGMNEEDNDYAGDFGTPEQEILKIGSDLNWESCMTMNNTWGFKKNDHNWKSDKQLIHNLIDIAAKGGNYLLNVGPTAEGLIPSPSIERLEKMGKWLSINGEAIYKTEKLKHSVRQGDFIRYTKKKEKNIYYAISLQSPKNNISFKNVIPNKNSNIFLLGYNNKPLDWKYSKETGIKIEISDDAIKSVGKTSAWVFKITGKENNQKKIER